MKRPWTILPLGTACIAVIALSSCQPIEQGPRDDDEPRRIVQAGQFARAVDDNTSFYRQLPLSGGQADLLLQRHTAMKVIKLDPGYSKVELDSGEIGFVQTAMLEAIPANKPDVPDGPGLDNGPPDILDPTPPLGPGMPDVLPPTIDPE